MDDLTLKTISIWREKFAAADKDVIGERAAVVRKFTDLFVANLSNVQVFLFLGTNKISTMMRLIEDEMRGETK